MRVEDVEGFEDGEFGWATIFSTLVAGDSETPLRTSMVLHIEAGVWSVIHFHNSIPVPNQQVFGVGSRPLSTTSSPQFLTQTAGCLLVQRQREP